MISCISMYFLENQRYSQIMFHKCRVLPGLCMFFLLFQFEKKTTGTTFLLDTRRNAEKKVGFETPSFSCAYFGSSNLTPEEKKRKKKERKGGVLFSAKSQYTVHDF